MSRCRKVKTPGYKNRAKGPTISILGEYELITIFEKLNPVDLLQAQYVCKRWNGIAARCWASKSVLNFSGCFKEHVKKGTNDTNFRDILKRCGRNIHTIDLSTLARFLSTESIQMIAKMCPNLEVANLSKSKLIMIELQQPGKWCNRLTELTLDGCTKLTDLGMREICSGCPRLRKLSVCGWGFSDLTSQGFSQISHLGQLRELYLAGNNSIDDVSLIVIGSRCHQMEVLDLSARGSKVSDASVEVFRGCPNLKRLDISYRKNVTDSTLLALAQAGALEELKARGNANVSNDGCQELLRLCPKLRLLDFSRCYKIERSVLDSCLRAVKARTVGPKLTVIIGGSGIQIEQGCDDFAHPLLHLQTEDLTEVNRLYDYQTSDSDPDFDSDYSDFNDFNYFLDSDKD